MQHFKYINSAQIDLHETQIESNRLKLQPIHLDFLDDVFSEFTSTITRYMLPKPAADKKETLVFIVTSQKNMKLNSEYVAVITNKYTGEFLGVCGLHGVDQCDNPELGIWLKQSAHGRHYGYEAIYALASWAATSIEFEYLIYPVDKANIPSRKIPEQLGGIIYTTQTVKTQSGHLLNEVVYKIPQYKLLLNH